MIDIIKWGGKGYSLEWFDDEDFSKLNNVTQVYGFLFDRDGKIVIVKHGDLSDWRLPGGGPEKVDGDWKDTIRRESSEEADVEISDIFPLGYIKVTPSDKKMKIHYLLRCAGKITRVNEQTVDEAVGIINERKFIEPSEFLSYCPWGNTGKANIEKAIRIWYDRIK